MATCAERAGRTPNKPSADSARNSRDPNEQCRLPEHGSRQGGEIGKNGCSECDANPRKRAHEFRMKTKPKERNGCHSRNCERNEMKCRSRHAHEYTLNGRDCRGNPRDNRSGCSARPYNPVAASLARTPSAGCLSASSQGRAATAALRRTVTRGQTP